MLGYVPQTAPLSSRLNAVDPVSGLVEGIDSKREKALMNVEKHRIAEERVDHQLRVRPWRLGGITPQAREIGERQRCRSQCKLRIGGGFCSHRHIQGIDCRPEVVALEYRKGLFWRNRMREHHYWIIGDIRELLEFGHPCKALLDNIGLIAKRLVVIHANFLGVMII